MLSMDFGALPPEMNSARMYAGPGPGPMLAAASAWRTLAAELGTVASSYQAVIAELTGQSWFGPASQAMGAAATPYADWLGTTAAAAEHTAGQLTVAVNDFEQAFAATVPPEAIAANRSQLADLVASNVAGQNATAIAATEAEYQYMWLQDAIAMYGYAARSAAATTMKPFTAPPPVADGSAGAGVADPQAIAGGAQNQLSQLLNAIPRALHGLSGSGSAQASPVDALAPAQSTDPASQAASYIEALARSVLPANDTNISVLYGMGQYARNLNTDLDISQATGGRAGFGSGTPVLSVTDSGLPGATRPAVAASTGSAGAIGKLAVPPVWAEATPEATPTATAAPIAPSATAAVPAGHGAGVVAPALAGLAAGRAGRRRHGDRTEAHSERIAGRLTGVDEVRHWHVEPGGLKSLLGEVIGQPGVHQVYFDTGEQIPPGSSGGPSFGSPPSSLAEPPDTGPQPDPR